MLNSRIFFLLVPFLLAPNIVFGHCDSLYRDTEEYNLKIYTDYRYELCYDEKTFGTMLDTAIEWINYAYAVGESKYKVDHPIHGHPCRDEDCPSNDIALTIFVHPQSARQVMNWCSYTTSGRCADSNFNRDSRYDTQAEIHVVYFPDKPSTWRGLSPREDFINTLVHEMMHFLHIEVVEGRWPRWLPRWVIEGLASFEGWNTTEEAMQIYNRDLVRWVDEDEIVLGYDLMSKSGADLQVFVTEPYHAGGLTSITLAELYGKDVHRMLLKMPLNEILAANDSDPRHLFRLIRRLWQSENIDDLN